MDKKHKSLRLTLLENELQQLENLAENEQRSLSNLVSIIVSEYLEKKRKEKENE